MSDDVRRADSAEVAEILVANHRQLLAFVERRVGSRAIAEEILQDAFVRGAGALEGSGESSVLAWLYTTLRHAIIDHQRRQQAAGRAVTALAAETDAAVDGETHTAVCQRVARLAGALKPEYGQALARIEVDGVAVKDYAAEAGISPSNAAVRVFRAREALRK